MNLSISFRAISNATIHSAASYCLLRHFISTVIVCRFSLATSLEFLLHVATLLYCSEYNLRCVVGSPYHSSYSRIVVNAALSFGHSFIPIVSRILTRSFFHLTTQFGVKELRPSLSIECPKKLPMKSHLYLQWICINQQYQDVAVYQVKCITHRHKK